MTPKIQGRMDKVRKQSRRSIQDCTNWIIISIQITHSHIAGTGGVWLNGLSARNGDEKAISIPLTLSPTKDACQETARGENGTEVGTDTSFGPGMIKLGGPKEPISIPSPVEGYEERIAKLNAAQAGKDAVVVKVIIHHYQIKVSCSPCY